MLRLSFARHIIQVKRCFDVLKPSRHTRLLIRHRSERAFALRSLSVYARLPNPPALVLPSHPTRIVSIAYRFFSVSSSTIVSFNLIYSCRLQVEIYQLSVLSLLSSVTTKATSPEFVFLFFRFLPQIPKLHSLLIMARTEPATKQTPTCTSIGRNL